MDAIDVLINKLKDIERAEDFAEKISQPDVWSKLGENHLNNGNVMKAMDSFMKCKDHTYYMRVIGLIEN